MSIIRIIPKTLRRKKRRPELFEPQAPSCGIGNRILHYFFLAGAFFAGAFLAGAFFAGAFLAGAFFAQHFVHAAFLAGAFFAGVAFFTAFLVVAIS
jgi:uncharacterized protein YjbI with pentapeptide repeats